MLLPLGGLEPLAENRRDRVGELGIVATHAAGRADHIKLGEVALHLFDLAAAFDHLRMVVAVVFKQRVELGLVFEQLLFHAHAGLLVAVAKAHRFEEGLLAEGLLDGHEALADVAAALDRLGERLVGGLKDEPPLLGLDHGGIELDGPFHERVHRLAVGLDAEVAHPLPHREKLSLLHLDLLIYLVLLLLEEIDERAGRAAVGFIHEGGVGPDDRRHHSRRGFLVGGAKAKLENVGLPHTADLQHLGKVGGEQLRIGLLKEAPRGLVEQLHSRLQHKRAAHELFVGGHRGEIIAAAGHRGAERFAAGIDHEQLGVGLVDLGGGEKVEPAEHAAEQERAHHDDPPMPDHPQEADRLLDRLGGGIGLLEFGVEHAKEPRELKDWN